MTAARREAYGAAIGRASYTHVMDLDQEPSAPPSTLYRCDHCGNRTRFDVYETVRRRRYHHYTLGGELAIDEEELFAVEVERVVCRWCNRSDSVVERPPAFESDTLPF